MANQYIAVQGLDRGSRVRVPGWGAPVNEVQNVTLTGTPSSGTFTLTYSGQTTAAIAFDASVAAVDAALEALSNIGAGDVTVSGVAGAWVVTFTGALAGTDVAAITATDVDLDPGTVEVTQVTPGDDLDITPIALAPGVVAIVDIDRQDVRNALGHHSAVGQFAVVAANPNVHGTALPANT